MAAKRILITGAGSGLGEGSAFGLAAAGHKVIAACFTRPEVSDMRTKATAKGLEANLEVCKLDITDAGERQVVFNKYGKDVDILVCNAAIGEGGPISEIPTDRVRNQFEVNVFSQMDFVQPYIREMVARKSGKICWLSSIAGVWTTPFIGAYCMSKHAIEAMAHTMRQELAGTGVKVCTINPAPFNTGFNDRNLDTVNQWYDPNVNFTPEQPMKEFAGAMATMLQYDPQSMIDEMVRVIPLDNHRFREMWTPDWEVNCKAYQAQAWAMDMDGNVPDNYWGKNADDGAGRDVTPPAPFTTHVPHY